MVVELWQQIPDFNYQAIDRRLMQFGVELTLLGILQIDPATELFHQTDHVIRFIKKKIQNEPKVQHATAEEVSEALELREERVALIFGLMNHLGHFWNGAAGSRNFPGYTSITIEHESVKRQYLKYDGLEPLLQHFSKLDQKDTANTPKKATFVHDLLDWKFKEHLDAALNSVDRLQADDVLTYDADKLAKLVERFVIPELIVHTNSPIRDEKIPELEDLILDRKTGETGHIFLIPIDGDPEWLQEIDMQTVITDEHPLAFLNKAESWIYIKLTVALNDPDGALKQKLDQRLALVAEYADYVAGRITEFNRDLAIRMTENLNRRKKAIQRGKIEAEGIGLPAAYNPKHAETAIQIQKLMQNLNARLVSGSNQSLKSARIQSQTQDMSDLHDDGLAIAKYMYENKFIGSRSITVLELREKTNLPEDDFNVADEYLLGAKIYSGTMGGDAGQRWLTPEGVNFVKTRLDRAENTRITFPRQQASVDVFISHSSKDAGIAKALVLLLRAALNIPPERIRCTSVDGYRLPVGASTDDQLRLELRESRVFLGLITKASIESAYVLFELGARWGAELQLAPVLVKSSDKELLRGPLSGLNALACDTRAQIHQLVDDVASHLQIIPVRASAYQESIDSLLESCGAERELKDQGMAQATPSIDFERMALHVDNYFTAKGFRHVGFQSIRKYVNASYSDELLLEMIDKFPERFRRVTLRGNRPAVGRVLSQSRSTQPT